VAVEVVCMCVGIDGGGKRHSRFSIPDATRLERGGELLAHSREKRRIPPSPPLPLSPSQPFAYTAYYLRSLSHTPCSMIGW